MTNTVMNNGGFSTKTVNYNVTLVSDNGIWQIDAWQKANEHNPSRLENADQVLIDEHVNRLCQCSLRSLKYCFAQTRVSIEDF